MQSTIITESVFGRAAVKRLSTDDFLLDSDTPTRSKWKDCTLILFYVNNVESQQLMQIWATAANLAAGPVFAGINISINDRVAQAFMQVRETPGPYRVFGLTGYPFILAYQGGHPVGYYNGERDVQAIADWALTLACRVDYFEPGQLAGAVSADISYEMAGFTDLKPRTNSTQFKAGEPMRQFDSSKGVVRTGSQAASQAATSQAAERAVAGQVTSGPIESGVTGEGVTVAAPTAVAPAAAAVARQ